MIKLSLRVLIILISLPLVACSGNSEDNTEAALSGARPIVLLQTLAQIPDTPETRAGIISYADFRAAEDARPGAARPQSWVEFLALRDADDPSVAIWSGAVLVGIRSGPRDLYDTIRSADSLPGTVGFDFFDINYDINQAVEYGNPPNQGVVLAGDFNAEAIGTAFAAREYVQSDINGLILWCGPIGCDRGMEANPSQRDIANPFGGNLGRQQPLLIAPGYVFSSPQITLVEAQADVMAGDASSLAEVAEYRATTEAIARYGNLIQAQFVNPDLFPPVMDIAAILGSRQIDEDAIATLTAQLGLAENFVPLPAYSLMTLADTADDEYQRAMVALVYDDRDTANSAGEIITERLNTMVSLTFQRPLIEVIVDRGAEVETEVYVSEATSKAVLLVILRAPLPSNEPGSSPSTTIEASGIPFALLVDMLYRRDLGWLAVGELEMP